MPGELTPPEFVEKWKRVELSERAASQEHFIDLCNLLGPASRPHQILSRSVHAADRPPKPHRSRCAPPP